MLIHRIILRALATPALARITWSRPGREQIDEHRGMLSQRKCLTCAEECRFQNLAEVSHSRSSSINTQFEAPSYRFCEQLYGHGNSSLLYAELLITEPCSVSLRHS
jgi:hypothetical protein